jgi:hypothetical protein
MEIWIPASCILSANACSLAAGICSTVHENKFSRLPAPFVVIFIGGSIVLGNRSLYLR